MSFLTTLKKVENIILGKKSNDNKSKANRNALLCTYLKKDANFRPGNTAKRKPFKLVPQ